MSVFNQILLTIFVLSHQISFGQWVNNEQNETKIYTDSIITSEWSLQVNYGSEGLYCGLPCDNDSIKYKYYKRYDRSDLIYYERKDLSNGTKIIGFYRLFNDKYPDVVVSCWLVDMLQFHFDRNGNLVKQEFYNLGQRVTPTEFRLVEKTH